jgi:hypothetical protein
MAPIGGTISAYPATLPSIAWPLRDESMNIDPVLPGIIPVETNIRPAGGAPPAEKTTVPPLVPEWDKPDHVGGNIDTEA